ncbi:MAG: divalent-cation tolerance protein CutA [Bacteroidia bacterium]|nr:divalent-cation tolerance protein CutA [Bacteroidia bacterium]
MILLHIASADDGELASIATLLLKEKLVADVRIDTIRRLLLNDNGELEEVPRFLLICKTKSLLFNNIVDFIREKHSTNLPEIYALPLVSMERSQEELIRSRTKAV